MHCSQSNARGSFLQMCINFVEQRLKFSHFEGSLKAKFDLYRFIPLKAVCLEIPGLDLAGNTLLILLCSVYLFTKC